MSVSFQARDKLMMEKAKLEAKLEASNDQIVTLKSHVGMIRKNTIAFILEQMDALHIQRDTEVWHGEDDLTTPGGATYTQQSTTTTQQHYNCIRVATLISIMETPPWTAS